MKEMREQATGCLKGKISRQREQVQRPWGKRMKQRPRGRQTHIQTQTCRNCDGMEMKRLRETEKRKTD